MSKSKGKAKDKQGAPGRPKKDKPAGEQKAPGRPEGWEPTKSLEDKVDAALSVIKGVESEGLPPSKIVILGTRKLGSPVHISHIAHGDLVTDLPYWLNIYGGDRKRASGAANLGEVVGLFCPNERCWEKNRYTPLDWKPGIAKWCAGCVNEISRCKKGEDCGSRVVDVYTPVLTCGNCGSEVVPVEGAVGMYAGEGEEPYVNIIRVEKSPIILRNFWRDPPDISRAHSPHNTGYKYGLDIGSPSEYSSQWGVGSIPITKGGWSIRIVPANRLERHKPRGPYTPSSAVIGGITKGENRTLNSEIVQAVLDRKSIVGLGLANTSPYHGGPYGRRPGTNESAGYSDLDLILENIGYFFNHYYGQVAPGVSSYRSLNDNDWVDYLGWYLNDPAGLFEIENLLGKDLAHRIKKVFYVDE